MKISTDSIETFPIERYGPKEDRDLKPLVLSILFCAISSPAFGQSAPESEPTHDEQKVLAPVTTTEKRPEKEGPKTGRVFFRPILYPGGRQAITSTEEVIFVFSPIEQPDDGPAILYEGEDRARFRSTMFIPGSDGPTRIKIKIDRYPTQAVELPGGTYALTEIIYQYFITDSAARVVEKFCLSKGSIAFDIRNGETSYLGALAIADIPDNRARYKRHTPIISLSRDVDTITGRASRIEDLQLTDFDGITFDPENGICNNSDYFVSAWKQKK